MTATSATNDAIEAIIEYVTTSERQPDAPPVTIESAVREALRDASDFVGALSTDPELERRNSDSLARADTPESEDIPAVKLDTVMQALAVALGKEG
jgi:hypothetical protein